MNNLQFNEARLLSCALTFPSLAPMLDPAQFFSPNYREMCKDLKSFREQNPHLPADVGVLFGKKNKEYTDYDVQMLNDYMRIHAVKEEEAAKKIIEVDIYLLKQEHKRRFLHDIVSEALADCDRVGYNAAISKLKMLRFDDTYIAPQKTLDVMLDSLVTSNGFSSGIPELDERTGGWYLGNILTLAGDTGSQKTMFSLWLCLQVLKANPTFKAIYFEKEMPVKDIGRRLIAHFCKIESKEILEASKKEDKSQQRELHRTVQEVMEEYSDIIDRLIVVGNDQFATPADMFQWIESQNAQIWVLDYMSLLENGSKSTSEKAYTVMDNMHKLKEIALSTKTFGIIISQLKGGTVEMRPNKIPTKDDLEWSSDIKKLSSYILGVFYPAQYYKKQNKDWYFIQSLKNRNEENYVLPFLTTPQHCTFRTPDPTVKMSMESWLHAYSKGVETT